MKLAITSLLIALIAIFIASCSNQTTRTSTSSPSTNNGATAAATPDPFAEARGVFAKNCQSCHGIDGKGGPVKLEDGTRLRVPSLREGHALKHPDSDFLKQIMAGGDGMPAFKDKIKQPQIDDLIKFIRHEFQGGMTPPPEKSPTKDMKM